jgi:hypothetical protein
MGREGGETDGTVGVGGVGGVGVFTLLHIYKTNCRTNRNISIGSISR